MKTTDDTNRRVYTLGHSNRTFDTFARLLREHTIELVVDVRSLPRSVHTQFSQPGFEQRVQRAGIAYIHLPELGGLRTEPYPSYMRSERFRIAYAALERRCEQDNAALVCAERSPSNCHRRFIAQALIHNGWEVIHILDRGETDRERRQTTLDRF